jgi:hypothetical protein
MEMFWREIKEFGVRSAEYMLTLISSARFGPRHQAESFCEVDEVESGLLDIDGPLGIDDKLSQLQPHIYR